MLRSAMLLVVCMPGMGSHAQNWCPPGATWTYYCSSWCVSGVTAITYEGDTLMGDTLAQVLRMRTNGYDHCTGHDTTVHWGSAHTTIDGDLVRIWNGSRFDTLYWFGAVPGDRWYMSIDPNIDYDQFVIEVVDTGHVVRNGVPLRYLEVYGLDHPVTDTIFERIGTRRQFMIPAISIYLDAYGGPLRTYCDGQVEYHVAPGPIDCDLATDLRSLDAPHSTIHPNPGTDRLILSLPPGAHTITLFDATGRVAMAHSEIGERVTIDTSHLSSGIHAVRIDEGPRTVRWVKE